MNTTTNIDTAAIETLIGAYAVHGADAAFSAKVAGQLRTNPITSLSIARVRSGKSTYRIAEVEGMGQWLVCRLSKRHDYWPVFSVARLSRLA
jgi:hypothetical protein